MQRHLTTATIEVTLYADNQNLSGAVAVLDEFMEQIRQLVCVHHAAALTIAEPNPHEPDPRPVHILT
jgi:hypothetical protein